jgi:hypothetical protein
MNIWRITYGYLGVLPAQFEIYGGPGIGWIHFAYISIIGSGNQLAIENPFLPLRMHVTSDGTNEVTMYTGSWSGGTIFIEASRGLHDQFSYDYDVTLGAGTTPIISIRNNTTFQSKTNHTPISFHNLTAAVDGNKIHKLRLVKNGTLTASTFGISPDANSVAAIDTAATAISGGKLLRSYPMGATDSLGIGPDFDIGEMLLFPGEHITLVLVTTSTAPEVSAAFHWEELK